MVYPIILEALMATIGTTSEGAPNLLRGLTPATSVADSLRRDNDSLGSSPNVSISEGESINVALSAEAAADDASQDAAPRQEALPRPADPNRGQQLDFAV